jgi:4-aminobutyrate aminotransferase/(S)-3-amino-2-methylpropionate transaminase
MRERGVLIGIAGTYANVLRFQPPLSITADECERAADALEAVLRASP